MVSGRIIVFVLFLLSLFAGFVTGLQLYYRLAYLWGLLLLFSWAWSKLILWGVQIRRLPRATRAQAGQVFEERFEINNPGRLPRVWLVVRDESPLPGTQGSRLFPLVEGRRGRTYLARTRLSRRGVYPLGPTILESGDPFGLFPVSRELPANDALLVYPMLFEVDHFPNPAGILPGGEALRRRTHQVTPNAAEVRDYAPGDPLNRIHWVSTARRGRLISKEFELDPQAEVWIFLDSSRTGQAGLPYQAYAEDVEDLWKRKTEATLPPSTEEYGVSIAASLSRYFLRQGRAVGFVSSGQSLSLITPDRGGRQLSKILESLALLRAEGDLPLRGLVEIQAQHLPRGSTVVLITHSVEEDVALTADYLTRRGLRPVLVLIDASTFNGPSGTDQLAEMVRFLRIPFRVVHRGDHLGAALSDRG
ncbi:MAG TPA: DUF58 domain-containing protein [Anaerolineales bacterium]